MERLKISYKGINGALHVAFLTPLVRKDAILVHHIILEVLGSFETGDLTNVLKTLDGEKFWALACKLLRYSTIDLKECKDLAEFDGFDGKSSDLYPLVIEALKANYPDFFEAMKVGLSGLIGSIGQKEEAPK
jgi:hypothetical protein